MKMKLNKKYLGVLVQWVKKKLPDQIKKGEKKVTLLICPYCGQVAEIVKTEPNKIIRVEIQGEKDCTDCTNVRLLEPMIFTWIGRVLGFQQMLKGD